MGGRVGVRGGRLRGRRGEVSRLVGRRRGRDGLVREENIE